MTASGISQTGIESSLINQQRNTLFQQGEAKTASAKDVSDDKKDAVILTSPIRGKKSWAIDAIAEVDAVALAQSAARDLGKTAFSLCTQNRTEALKALI